MASPLSCMPTTQTATARKPALSIKGNSVTPHDHLHSDNSSLIAPQCRQMTDLLCLLEVPNLPLPALLPLKALAALQATCRQLCAAVAAAEVAWQARLLRCPW